MVKVMIGVATAEMGRYAAFHDYFNLLDKPHGSVISVVHGQSPAKSRNLIFQQALEHDCTHVLLIDDDMTFAPDSLTKLLAHDVDAVGGYYLTRSYPHQGLIFDTADEKGFCGWWELPDEQTGLVEVKGCGFGFFLIKTNVYKDMEQPWVRLGEIVSDGWCDDLGFMRRLRETGTKIHIDLDVPCGHIANVIVSPERKDGKWMVCYNTFCTESIVFPMVRTAKHERPSTD